MRTAAVALLVLGLGASSVAAQNRGRGNGHVQGIPPGHLPPPGECRVWYDGRPPGQQPPPTSCREAERVAARDRHARVVYGSDRDRPYHDDRDRDVRDRNDRDRDDRDRDGYEDRGDRGRAVPRDSDPDSSRDPDRSSRYPERYPIERGGYGYDSVPFDNGYKDGLEKGTEDWRDGDSPDPVRHSQYRSADRGYNSRYGSRDDYKDAYRAGFRTGYEDGYRRRSGPDSDRR